MSHSIDQTLELAIERHYTGQFAEAEALYRQILAERPDHAQTLQVFGILAAQSNRHELAFDLFRRAIAIDPTVADFYLNFGTALTERDHIADAIACYRQALALQPDFALAHYNLGNNLLRIGQVDEAIASHRRSLALRPDYAPAHDALGGALRDKGLHDEALASYRRALELAPDYPEGHRSYGFSLLLTGDYAVGWPEFEWRHRIPNAKRLDVPQPRWDGGDLHGRTILLHDEQGFGDTLIAARYVKLVAQRGGVAIVLVQPALTRLMRSSLEGLARVVDGPELPAFDVHCPLLSLPHAFRTTLETIPREVPYVRPDPDDVERWRARLAIDLAPLKVGLAWAGNKNQKNDHNRSMPFAALRPLLGANVRFYSLQKGEPARQAIDAPPGTVIDWTNDLHDFADTAALVANLDLVVTVDTSIAHLAGAMGKPVWTMLAFTADWRWLLRRNDSPWYPTMRLFRQPTIGDWGSVVAAVAEALRDF